MSSTATRKFRPTASGSSASTARGRSRSYTPTANPEFNQAMQLIGRSSATQKHDSRPNRQRSRHAAKRAAISRGGW